jgi:hypothetical protein
LNRSTNCSGQALAIGSAEGETKRTAAGDVSRGLCSASPHRSRTPGAFACRGRVGDLSGSCAGQSRAELSDNGRYAMVDEYSESSNWVTHRLDRFSALAFKQGTFLGGDGSFALAANAGHIRLTRPRSSKSSSWK